MAYAMPPLPKGEVREATKYAAGRPYYAFYAPRGTKGYARKRKTTRFTGGFFFYDKISNVACQPHERLFGVKSLGVTRSELVDIALKDILKRNIQRSGGFRKVPGNVSKLFDELFFI